MLVHGLFGHPQNSWSIKTSRELQVDGGGEVYDDEPRRKKPRTGHRELFCEVFWPRDLLPVTFPQARIFTQTLGRQKHEAYIMFQIAIYARTPFGLYEFLAATLFLTTQKGTYPELQRLSLDQMHRRLNSRSAGLLEAATSKVQFIHQTVKEFMSTRIGILAM